LGCGVLKKAVGSCTDRATGLLALGQQETHALQQNRRAWPLPPARKADVEF